jgi:hypothetical protein
MRITSKWCVEEYCKYPAIDYGVFEVVVLVSDIAKQVYLETY